MHANQPEGRLIGVEGEQRTVEAYELLCKEYGVFMVELEDAALLIARDGTEIANAFKAGHEDGISMTVEECGSRWVRLSGPSVAHTVWEKGDRGRSRTIERARAVEKFSPAEAAGLALEAETGRAFRYVSQSRFAASFEVGFAAGILAQNLGSLDLFPGVLRPGPKKTPMAPALARRLECQLRCGALGNPQWHDLCSQCFCKYALRPALAAEALSPGLGKPTASVLGAGYEGTALRSDRRAEPRPSGVRGATGAERFLAAWSAMQAEGVVPQGQEVD
ncbi:unnamed protein product, partial [Effrenium voratum]